MRILWLIGLLLLTGCTPLSNSYPHLLMGNPSGASGGDLENLLLDKPQYALSYSATKGTANWVSWRLTQADLGPVGRCEAGFSLDPSLPATLTAIETNDYRRSGYDRGHLIPSGDRTANTLDNCATFVMTNIVPQTPENNRGTWADLEEYSRDLVKQGKELYIVAGPSGQQKRIAGQITVPTQLWKVILVLDQPGSGLQGITPSTQVIAVVIPNRKRLNRNWQSYITSVDRVEQLTGYDFFSAVSLPIQSVIESREAML